MTTAEDQAVYAAEGIAFADTPLGDRLDRRVLMHEACVICADPFVYPFTGDVRIEEASARLVSCVAYARGRTIRFAPTATHRSTVVHEIAHVVTPDPSTSHGPEFRAIFAELAAMVYGDEYGRLLRQAFTEMRLPVGPATLPRPVHPIVDIDRHDDMSREVRWLE